MEYQLWQLMPPKKHRDRDFIPPKITQGSSLHCCIRMWREMVAVSKLNSRYRLDFCVIPEWGDKAGDAIAFGNCDKLNSKVYIRNNAGDLRPYSLGQFRKFLRKEREKQDIGQTVNLKHSADMPKPTAKERPYKDMSWGEMLRNRAPGL